MTLKAFDKGFVECLFLNPLRKRKKKKIDDVNQAVNILKYCH